MSLLVDCSIEQGRFDVVHVNGKGASPVDVNLVLHVWASNEEKFARTLVEKTIAMYPDVSVHIRAKVYIADFNSLLVYPSDVGWCKWSEQLAGCAPQIAAARQHFANAALRDYKNCVREYGMSTFCTHEVCYTDGSGIYWAGQ